MDNNKIIYNQFPSKKTLMMGYELHVQAYDTIGVDLLDYRKLIRDIGITILEREIYLKDTDVYFRKILQNYYIDNEHLLIVRALFKPYTEILGIGNMIGVIGTSVKSLTNEQEELRNKLDRYFIEMLYSILPLTKNSGLPVIFCDTSVESELIEHPASSYYLL